jgi:hypothetical protein
LVLWISINRVDERMKIQRNAKVFTLYQRHIDHEDYYPNWKLRYHLILKTVSSLKKLRKEKERNQNEDKNMLGTRHGPNQRKCHKCEHHWHLLSLAIVFLSLLGPIHTNSKFKIQIQNPNERKRISIENWIELQTRPSAPNSLSPKA